jgi:Fe-S-cluster containining protein
MKTVTRSEDCVVCKDCCQFSAQKLYFAPLFTDIELAALTKTLPADSLRPAFHRHQGSRTVWQIELRPSRTQPHLYVCPFLDETTHLCAIYPNVPFDCRLWPFLVSWSMDGRRLELACVERRECPSLLRVGSEAFAAYTRYLLDYLRRPEFVQLLRTHRALIWPHQPDSIVLANLTADFLGATQSDRPWAQVAHPLSR